jgi:hypothetical protein
MRYPGISQQGLNKIGINGRFINVSCNVYIVSVHEASDPRLNPHHVENRSRGQVRLPARRHDSCMDV